ncbi:MAG: aspartate--tRNA(Asn) ligase [Clostridia bacterium]|nr:aspartate--tRNA(Asn) ligase [Clostridia bacterium]
MTELRAAAAGGERVEFHGAVHAVRDMGGFSFLLVRIPDGVVQCTMDAAGLPDGLAEECCVAVGGTARAEDRAPGGVEIAVDELRILSRPSAGMPVPVNKWKTGAALETELALRPLTLRNTRERAVFRIQSEIVRGFRDFLHGEGFIEVHTPKIVSASAEGGANVFRLDYFGRKAFLAQSPQFYKQMMVGVYERVFEVGPVFRAEKHNTVRHLNEYVSLDFEMGYIRDFSDLCGMETAMLRFVFDRLRAESADDLRTMGVELPVIDAIPMVRFDEAKRAAAEAYGRRIRDPYDLEPEEEVLIGRYYKEKTGSDFVFVTHYPTKKRPFYAMDDPADPRFTLSFDLLFRGMEVTTGGQRIHDYGEQVAKMRAKNLDPEDFTDYLMIHKHGMPPHGGLGIGLERLCMKLFDMPNVRRASLFPRDLNRLTP